MKKVITASVALTVEALDEERFDAERSYYEDALRNVLDTAAAVAAEENEEVILGYRIDAAE